MDVLSVNEIYWRSFLLLEKQFLATFDAVKFDVRNAKTFSMKYRSIIFQACSEIEALLKLLCGVSLDENANMEKYRKFFKVSYAGFD